MLPPVLERPPVTPKVKEGLLLDGGNIRLNLGGIGDGNTQNLPGFLVVDLANDPAVDIRADVSDLSVIKTGSVDEIYASNVLEHFPHTETVKVLKEWRRVLKKGGTCWISVPDMDACFRMYQQMGLVPYVINLIWGDQIHPYAYHYVIFTFATLAKAIVEAGFSDIKRLVFFPFSVKDCSTHTDSVDRLPVSLNVKVTA